MVNNKRVFIFLIKGASKRWGIPENVLIEVARLYSLYAMRYGDAAAFVKGMGYVLDKNKFHYLIRRIKRQAVDNFQPKKKI